MSKRRVSQKLWILLPKFLIACVNFQTTMRGEAAHWTATTLVVTGSSAAGAMPQMMMAVTGGAATTSMWRIGTVRIVPHSTNWGFEKVCLMI